MMDLALIFLGYLMFDILDNKNKSVTTKVIAAGIFVLLLFFSIFATIDVATSNGDKTPKVQEIKIEDGPKADF